MRVYRPGWVGVFELGRSGVLVAVGGGWFSKNVLVSLLMSHCDDERRLMRGGR